VAAAMRSIAFIIGAAARRGKHPLAVRRIVGLREGGNAVDGGRSRPPRARVVAPMMSRARRCGFTMFTSRRPATRRLQTARPACERCGGAMPGHSRLDRCRFSVRAPCRASSRAPQLAGCLAATCSRGLLLAREGFGPTQYSHFAKNTSSTLAAIRQRRFFLATAARPLGVGLLQLDLARVSRRSPRGRELSALARRLAAGLERRDFVSGS